MKHQVTNDKNIPVRKISLKIAAFRMEVNCIIRRMTGRKATGRLQMCPVDSTLKTEGVKTAKGPIKAAIFDDYYSSY